MPVAPAAEPVRSARAKVLAVLFGIGNVAATGSFVFYDSLLPHIASPDEVDRVSTAGYALGYVGGGILLAIQLAAISKPEWFGLADSDTAVRVAWQGGNAVTQVLQRCSNLRVAVPLWQAIHTNPAPTERSADFVDATATNGVYFYRVTAKR